MKKLVALLTLASATQIAYAYVPPSDADIVAYQTRAALYVSMGQTPDQIATSLRNYFGKDYFVARSNGWDGTAGIQVQIGDLNEITYMQVITTVKEM